MWVEARVTRGGKTVPAFQIDEEFAGEIGKRVWCVGSAGRLQAQVGNKKVLLSRYIWLLHTGDWPKQEIDHINRDPMDNRVANLRDVSSSENSKNRTPLYQVGKARAKDSSLPTGVRLVKRLKIKRHEAYIRNQGRFISLGYFATPEEAHAAYLAEVQRIKDEACVSVSSSA